MANDFYIIEDIDNIGKLKSGGNPFIWPQKHSSLFAAFYPERIKYTHEEKEIEAQRFNTGYIDNEKKFYPSPLKIGYVLIDSYIIFEIEESWRAFRTALIYDFDLYSQDFKNKRKLHFQFQNSLGTALRLNIIETTINYLNLYIESGFDINEIDAEKLSKDGFNLLNPKALLNAINQLEFEFTDYSENRVGRDNHFWTGTGIENLTEDIYMRKLILDNIDIDEKSHYGYSPASSPHSYKDERESNRLRTDLIVSALPKFNSMEQFFNRIQKAVKSNK